MESHSVSSVPFVYVRSRKTKKLPLKKVLLLHKNLPGFIASIQKILNWKDPIRCLLRDDGTVVESLDDLSPGMTVLASTLDPDFERKRSAVIPEPPRPVSPKVPTVATLTDPLAVVSFDNVSFAKQKKPKQSPRVLIPPITNKIQDLPIVSSTAASPYKISRRLSSESDEEVVASKLGKSRFLSKAVDEGVVAEKGSVKVVVDGHPGKKRDAQGFQELLAELFLPESVPACVPDALVQIPKDRKELAEAAPEREGELLYLWVHDAARQPLIESVEKRPYNDPMMATAAKFFNNHRQVTGGYPSYVFRGMIIGPAQSGKSTLLVSLAMHYMCELAAHGLWKSTFVFVFDLKAVAHLIPDPKRIYEAMLDLVLNAVIQQKPAVRREAARIRKQLDSVCEDHPPIAARHSYRHVDRLAKELNALWRDSEGHDSWYSNVWMLPQRISRAVGFKSVALFMDNIETGDIEIKKDTHFALHHTSGGIEFIKYSLSHVNFVVAGGNQIDLYDCMLPTETGGIDCLEGVDFISTCGVVTDLGTRTKMKYAMSVQEEPLPIEVTVDMCGGSASYIAAWDALNVRMHRLESTISGTHSWNNAYYDVLAVAQNLVALLFTCPGSPKITVRGVTRIMEKAHSSLSASAGPESAA
jgi:hypothetical protein